MHPIEDGDKKIADGNWKLLEAIKPHPHLMLHLCEARFCMPHFTYDNTGPEFRARPSEGVSPSAQGVSRTQITWNDLRTLLHNTKCPSNSVESFTASLVEHKHLSPGLRAIGIGQTAVADPASCQYLDYIKLEAGNSNVFDTIRILKRKMISKGDQRTTGVVFPCDVGSVLSSTFLLM